MNRIRLLPDHVANQIAAGEVVERPASVVKELVENALDAGARRVRVEIEAGGRSLIRVTDDGVGMSPDDALLCLERHATSKIRRAEDLEAIGTLGFRGEALPSIASVSRLALTTRERDSDRAEAAQVLIHGGKLIDVKAASGPPGTTLEIRALFFNLPARRKFLRSEDTERAHIQHTLTLAALAHPEVGFTLVQDGRLTWQLPPIDRADGPAALRERLRALHGGRDEQWLRVEHAAELPPTRAAEPEEEDGAAVPLRVWGFIGAPGVSRATREEQHLFVNRRPVENRGLNHALLEGYHTALMKGRYPVACVFLELSPAEVDVNIHPAKREVKFRRERLVRQHVTQAVRSALLGFHAAPAPIPPAPSSPGARAVPPPAPGPPSDASAPPEVPVPVAQELPSFPGLSRGDRLGTARGPADVGSRVPADPVPADPVPATAPATAGVAATAGATPMQAGAAGGPESAPPAVAAPGLAGGAQPLLAIPLRLVGVIGRLYVVLESDRGLVLLDQHAAHERILFERMLERLERGEAPSQRLLLAETVELSPRDALFLRQQLPVLTRLGVGLSEFGDRTFLLDAVPPFVKAGDARRFVLDLVDELKAAGAEVNALRLGEQVVAKTVCRHAVKANDPLAGRELEHLVEDLRRCAMPYTCPHGRPTLIEFNYRDLERKFGRVS